MIHLEKYLQLKNNNNKRLLKNANFQYVIALQPHYLKCPLITLLCFKKPVCLCINFQLQIKLIIALEEIQFCSRNI